MAAAAEFELKQIYEAGLFSSLDYHFAKQITRIFKETHPVVCASCGLLSMALGKGHICLDLKQISSDKKKGPVLFDSPVNLPGLSDWLNALEESSMVSKTTTTPLVLDGFHLYLSKYYDFQSRLIKLLVRRAGQGPEVDDEHLQKALLISFSGKGSSHTQAQKNAVQHAVSRPLTIISGGPGTGKTHVIGIIRKVLISMALKKNEPEPEILCLAPTGKAASKLVKGKTIHSVLKPLTDRPGFYYCKKRPLCTDIVIVDEASMIDIVLLTRLLEAIPDSAKIIILGDKHQLSSIQAGSVFHDLCASQTLSGQVFLLDYNFRSQGKTGIEKLSRAINENRFNQIEQILTHEKYEDIQFIDSETDDLEKRIKEQVITWFAYVTKADQPDILLTHIDDFKILCPHNSGRYGTLSINHICENILRSRENFDIYSGQFNRLIMVKTNDYHKNLFNGDTGIIIENEKGSRAYFKNQENRIRQYRIPDLPEHDPAFAITIHKSQGSEFDTVFILIPDSLSPVLTRQLLYTGVTRAKNKVILAGRLEIIKQAVNVAVTNTSGLIRGLDRAANKEQ